MNDSDKHAHVAKTLARLEASLGDDISVEQLAEESRLSIPEVRDHIELINVERRRLRFLKLQQATKGGNTPTEILMEIEELQQKLGESNQGSLTKAHSRTVKKKDRNKLLALSPQLYTFIGLPIAIVLAITIYYYIIAPLLMDRSHCEDYTTCIVYAQYFRRYGRYPEAINILNRAVDLDPEQSKAYGLRGTTYLDVKKYTEAEQDLTKAISISPNIPDFYFNRGRLYQEVNKNELALQDFKDCLEETRDDEKYQDVRKDCQRKLASLVTD
jgi:tetratricopeptide (TPR) repeat protein